MVYISAKLLESNGIVTFSTPKKKELNSPYEKPYENPWLTYCPTALDVKISDTINNFDYIHNDVLDNITAAIQSTNNHAINRQLLQQDPVFFLLILKILFLVKNSILKIGQVHLSILDLLITGLQKDILVKEIYKMDIRSSLFLIQQLNV